MTLSVTNEGFGLSGEMDADRFHRWIGTLLAENGVGIFRSKGILAVAGEENLFVFQGGHMLIHSDEGPPWVEDEQRVRRLVIIGRNLDRDELDRLGLGERIDHRRQRRAPKPRVPCQPSWGPPHQRR